MNQDQLQEIRVFSQLSNLYIKSSSIWVFWRYVVKGILSAHPARFGIFVFLMMEFTWSLYFYMRSGSSDSIWFWVVSFFELLLVLNVIDILNKYSLSLIKAEYPFINEDKYRQVFKIDAFIRNCKKRGLSKKDFSLPIKEIDNLIDASKAKLYEIGFIRESILDRIIYEPSTFGLIGLISNFLIEGSNLIAGILFVLLLFRLINLPGRREKMEQEKNLIFALYALKQNCVNVLR